LRKTLSKRQQLYSITKMPAAERSPSGLSTSSARPKKTKQDKIFELESSLKLAKEENRGLKKEVHHLKSGGKAPSRKSVDVDVGDVDKMKDALKTLKRVTVNQERSLKSLRDKSSQRRKQLQEKDSIVHSLQRQVRSLQKTVHANNNGGESDLKDQLIEMQRVCFDEESRNIELEDLLAQREQDIKRLEKEISTGGLQRTPSTGSLKSLESTSTTAEFDVAKLKKELAHKTNKIVKLEMQVEALNDQMYDIKRRKPPEDAFGSDPFGSNLVVGNNKGTADPFADTGSADPFADNNNGAFGDFNGDEELYSDEDYDEEEDEDNFW